MMKVIERCCPRASRVVDLVGKVWIACAFCLARQTGSLRLTAQQLVEPSFSSRHSREEIKLTMKLYIVWPDPTFARKFRSDLVIRHFECITCAAHIRRETESLWETRGPRELSTRKAVPVPDLARLPIDGSPPHGYQYNCPPC